MPKQSVNIYPTYLPSMTFETVNNLRNNKMVIVYHAKCYDGVAAAWALKSEFPHAETIPWSYQKPLTGEILSLVTDAVVLVADFSFGAEDTAHICGLAKHVELLDHHISALQKLEGFRADNFDMSSCTTSRSGCGIAWTWLHGTDPMPPLLMHIEDRDLWRFKLLGTRQIMAGLSVDGATFEVLDKHAYSPNELGNMGIVALKLQQSYVESIIAQSSRVYHIQGLRIALVNCNGAFASEVGSVLAQQHHVAITYFDTHTEGRKFSLRSKGDINVAAICENFGGGGHKNAAGYFDADVTKAVRRLFDFLHNSDLVEVLNK